MISLRAFAAISISILLSACGATSTGANVRRESSEKALAEQRANLDAMLAKLEIRQPALGSSALVIIPSKETIVSVILRRDPKKETSSFLPEYFQRDKRFLFEVLQKSQLFHTVETRDADAPLDEAKKEHNNFDAVVYLHHVPPRDTSWYVLRKGIDEPQLIEVDKLTKGLPRIESWVDGVEIAYKTPTLAQGEQIQRPKREHSQSQDCRGVGATQLAAKGALPAASLGLIGFVGAVAIQATSAIATDASGCN